MFSKIDLPRNVGYNSFIIFLISYVKSLYARICLVNDVTFRKKHVHQQKDFKDFLQKMKFLHG